jgi:hypothetical protein
MERRYFILSEKTDKNHKNPHPRPPVTCPRFVPSTSTVLAHKAAWRKVPEKEEITLYERCTVTSNALYSPSGRSHVSVISVSEM